MFKFLFLILFFSLLYGEESEYVINIEKNVEETPFTKNEIIKMAKLGVTVALDGEGYQSEEKVKESMLPKDLIQAKLLNLKGINLQIIPSWLFRFHNLRYLNLSNTNIDIGEVKKLLSQNTFEKLDVLILSNNSLFQDSNESFNDVTNTLSVLNSIDLSNTGGKAFNYMGIDKIDNLQELNLGHNKIKIIELLGLNKLKNLQKLNLSFNNLENINLNLFPKSTTSINLSNNNLKKLEVSEFQYLEKLDLTNNLELQENKKLCGEFIFPSKSVIRGNSMCNKHHTDTKNINYLIRLGVFSKKENAKKILNRLLNKKFPISIITKSINSKLLYSVQIGFYDEKKEAIEVQKTLPKKYRKSSNIYKKNNKIGTKYVVRFGLYTKITNKIKKIHNDLLGKGFTAFIIKRKIDNNYLYSLEIGFFLNIDIAKSKKKEILASFPKKYFEEEPIIRKD
jgi:Leucine-rich repeat (LRR) protein